MRNPGFSEGFDSVSISSDSTLSTLPDRSALGLSLLPQIETGDAAERRSQGEEEPVREVSSDSLPGGDAFTRSLLLLTSHGEERAWSEENSSGAGERRDEEASPLLTATRQLAERLNWPEAHREAEEDDPSVSADSTLSTLGGRHELVEHLRGQSDPGAVERGPRGEEVPGGEVAGARGAASGGEGRSQMEQNEASGVRAAGEETGWLGGFQKKLRAAFLSPERKKREQERTNLKHDAIREFREASSEAEITYNAIKIEYRGRKAYLDIYEQRCGTWQILSDTTNNGGARENLGHEIQRHRVLFKEKIEPVITSQEIFRERVEEAMGTLEKNLATVEQALKKLDEVSTSRTSLDTNDHYNRINHGINNVKNFRRDLEAYLENERHFEGRCNSVLDRMENLMVGLLDLPRYNPPEYAEVHNNPPDYSEENPIPALEEESQPQPSGNSQSGEQQDL